MDKVSFIESLVDYKGKVMKLAVKCENWQQIHQEAFEK
jgi:hypothetical protein